MILKSLIMQGFKSFPDKTVLDFNSGITAVVGPNGSGKSNISDAVRWVLGEQSTKSLRGAKMEDVIFGGTEKRKKMGYAQASLVFDNSARSVNIDSDEITVTRRYYRSGESDYEINGEASRLRDIHELFMDTGIGRDGYSIISQGRIADIISSRANERRDIFDEAAGISRFKYRRADAQKKLNQAEENLVRLRDILSELESRVGPLKEQAEKAEKFIVLAGEKKELEIGLWLHTLDKFKVEIREQENKISYASAQYETAETELTEIEKEIESVIENTRLKTLKIEEIRQSISELEEAALQKDSQKAVIENTILHNNETIERIMKDAESALGSEKLMEQEKADREQEIAKLYEEVNKLLSELDNEKQALEQLISGGETVSKGMEALSLRLSSATLELSDKRVELSTAVSSLDEVKGRIEAIDQSFASKDSAVAELQEQKAQIEKEIEENNAFLSQMKNSSSGYERLLSTKEEKLSKLKAELDSIRLNSAQLSHKASNLEELEKNMDGYYGSVKSVMARSKRGELRGIHGTVSMLIKTDSKFEVAIETALGAAMQHVVTDSESDAKRAIQFLKQTNGGRCTFLPVATIKGTELDSRDYQSADGFEGIASRLVEADEKYSGIIKSLLGRTVVCDDMDNALKLAAKFGYKFRIVTLDGQVINAGGSMTGGSRKNNVGILGRSGEIERLRADEEKLNQKAQGLEKDIKEMAQSVASVRAEFEGMQGDMIRAQEESIRLESENRLVSEKLSDYNATAQALNDEKSALEARANQLTEKKNITEQDVTRLSAEISQCEAELEKASGEHTELLSHRQEIDGNISEINLKLVSFKKDIEANEQAIEAIIKQQEGHIDRCALMKAEAEEIRKKNAELEEVIRQTEREANELRERAKGSRDSIDERASERAELERKSGELRVLERSKTAEREKMSGELARLEERKASMLKEYDEIVAKLYDEYELTRREAEQCGIKLDNPSEAKKKLNEIKMKIKALGNVNVGAVEEYREVSERYNFMNEQVSDIERSKAELIKIVNELTESMRVRFVEQFNKINENFKICFTELFGGGSAQLILCDESDVLSCDIDIKVQPPGKNVQNIDLFSGGEKVMAAISLLFAILKVTPTPFCIFDEVEAALDDVNVNKYAEYMRKMTKNIQFIAITHRRGTMEEADVLYGVTMQEKGISKLLRLNTDEVAGKLGIDV